MNQPKQNYPNDQSKAERQIVDLALVAFLVANGNPLIKSPKRQDIGRKFVFGCSSLYLTSHMQELQYIIYVQLSYCCLSVLDAFNIL